jgi:2-polyprenyl-3-methyl-5-hydroxy-6-metoxy-1,4-benzoquinol methylase
MPDTTPTPNREQAGAFLDKLKASYQGAMLTMLLDVGHRTGLLAAAAQAPATAAELAATTGFSARHIREWASGLAVAGVLTFDATTQQFTFPTEHAMWLTGNRYTNLAPVAGMVIGLAPRADEVIEAMRTGGGVPYESYRPHFTHAMDQVGRARYDALLVRAYLPNAPGLTERLSEGATVADVGCGTGHCLNVMAQAFPKSTFTGYDFSDEAIALARVEATNMGLTNAKFEVADVRELPADAFDVVFAFDAIHDQADPGGVLAQIRAAIRTGGEFFMVDIRASSYLEDNISEAGNVIIYGTSLFHCMEVSLAQGGAGLGTAWGKQLATSMLHDAGFADVVIHDIEADPSNCIYVCRPSGNR